jgi:hypothetical protein
MQDTGDNVSSVSNWVPIDFLVNYHLLLKASVAMKELLKGKLYFLKLS